MTDALETAAHDDSLPHDYGASKAVQLIAKTMRWTMENCLCETTSKTSKGTVKLKNLCTIHRTIVVKLP